MKIDMKPSAEKRLHEIDERLKRDSYGVPSLDEFRFVRRLLADARNERAKILALLQNNLAPTSVRVAGGKAMYPVQSIDLFDEVWRASARALADEIEKELNK